MNIATQTKGIFTDYLKTIAKLTGSTNITVQAIIFTGDNFEPILAGVGKDGWVKDESGKKLKTFTIREIIGLTMSMTLQTLGVDIKDEIKDILTRICHDENIVDSKAESLNVRILADDSFYRELNIFLYKGNTLIKPLTWEYVLGENASEDDENETDD